MDEAEKYQKRLSAIAEKRRLQEEQERAKRQQEDEKLRLQQMKRKSLRDQWLMDGPPLSPNSAGPQSPLWSPKAQPLEQQIHTLLNEAQEKTDEHMEDVLTLAKPQSLTHHHGNSKSVRAVTPPPSVSEEKELQSSTSLTNGTAEQQVHRAPLQIATDTGTQAETLIFLGYTEAEPGQGLCEDDEDSEVIRAERVIITDDGEEVKIKTIQGAQEEEKEGGVEEVQDDEQRGNKDVQNKEQRGVEEELQHDEERGVRELQDEEKRGRDGVQDKEERGRDELRDEEERGRDELRDEDERGKEEVQDEEEWGKQEVQDEEEWGKQEVQDEEEWGKQEVQDEEEWGKQEVQDEEERCKQEVQDKEERCKQEVPDKEERGKQEVQDEEERGGEEIMGEDVGEKDGSGKQEENHVNCSEGDSDTEAGEQSKIINGKETNWNPDVVSESMVLKNTDAAETELTAEEDLTDSLEDRRVIDELLETITAEQSHMEAPEGAVLTSHTPCTVNSSSSNPNPNGTKKAHDPPPSGNAQFQEIPLGGAAVEEEPLLRTKAEPLMNAAGPNAQDAKTARCQCCVLM